MNSKKVVFVAGPYTAPTKVETQVNVETALAAALNLRRYGFVPLVPHLLHYLDAYNRKTVGEEVPYEDWMDITLEYVRRSDAVYVVDTSPGASREIALAEELKIPVFSLYSSLVARLGESD
jgi:hypothetical protein